MQAQQQQQQQQQLGQVPTQQHPNNFVTKYNYLLENTDSILQQIPALRRLHVQLIKKLTLLRIIGLFYNRRKGKCFNFTFQGFVFVFILVTIVLQVIVKAAFSDNCLFDTYLFLAILFNFCQSLIIFLFGTYRCDESFCKQLLSFLTMININHYFATNTSNERNLDKTGKKANTHGYEPIGSNEPTKHNKHVLNISAANINKTVLVICSLFAIAYLSGFLVFIKPNANEYKENWWWLQTVTIFINFIDYIPILLRIVVLKLYFDTFHDRLQLFRNKYKIPNRFRLDPNWLSLQSNSNYVQNDAKANESKTLTPKFATINNNSGTNGNNQDKIDTTTAKRFSYSVGGAAAAQNGQSLDLTLPLQSSDAKASQMVGKSDNSMIQNVPNLVVSVIRNINSYGQTVTQQIGGNYNDFKLELEGMWSMLHIFCFVVYCLY